MLKLNTVLAPAQALVLRLSVGAGFGLALAWLSEAFKTEPPKWVVVLAATLALSAFILWAGAGLMRRLSLAVWYAALAAIVAFVVWHQVNVDAPGHSSFVAIMLLGPFAFITHELASSADLSNKPIAPYETYFDEAWKRGVQLIVSFVFTGLMWAILGLGALLLGFIGIKWFGDLLVNRYFYVPITGMALGAGFHLGDVRAKLLSNVRALILGVLAWLLPILTLMGVLFIGGLIVKGLDLLWATKAATFTLLVACVKFVLLINAAYQKGESDDAAPLSDTDRQISPILKITVRVACVLLIIFAGLAAYSLGLRIAQYGLTPERVTAGLGVVLACLYAVGYGVSAAALKGRWMHPLEKVNVALAFVMAGLFLCVMTPVADPRRLTVDDQVARLMSGKIKPERFDWYLLRYELGTYGTDALKVLKTSKDSNIAALAKRAEDGDAQRPVSDTNAPKPKPDLTKIRIVYPKGSALPASFLNTDFRGDVTGMPDCLLDAVKVATCEAMVIDITGDQKPEILILDERRMNVLDQRDGHWVSRTTDWLSDEDQKAFREGKVTLTPHRFVDIKIGNNVTSYDLEAKSNTPQPK
jgi:hypothetical protein